MDINTAYSTLKENPDMTASRVGWSDFINLEFDDRESELFVLNDMAGGFMLYVPSIADLKATDWICHE